MLQHNKKSNIIVFGALPAKASISMPRLPKVISPGSELITGKSLQLTHPCVERGEISKILEASSLNQA